MCAYRPSVCLSVRECRRSLKFDRLRKSHVPTVHHHIKAPPNPSKEGKKERRKKHVAGTNKELILVVVFSLSLWLLSRGGFVLRSTRWIWLPPRMSAMILLSISRPMLRLAKSKNAFLDLTLMSISLFYIQLPRCRPMVACALLPRHRGRPYQKGKPMPLFKQ